MKNQVNTECNSINAYVNAFNSKLEISKGHYKKSILWGNYFWKRFGFNSTNTFEFSVSFGN